MPGRQSKGDHNLLPGAYSAYRNFFDPETAERLLKGIKANSTTSKYEGA